MELTHRVNRVDPATTLRVVFTGGGTGGHFYPLTALYETAQTRWPGLWAAYIGSRRGLERDLARRYGWEVVLLSVRGLRGQPPWRLAVRLTGMLRASLVAQRWLARWRPHLVVCSGGYAGVPAAWAARRLHIPVLVHEQNVHPGWAVRWVARWARGVALAYPTDVDLDAPTQVVGMPVRPAFFRQAEARLPWPPFRILVLGGSQGSRQLNELLPPILRDLIQDTHNFEVIHQAGRGNVEIVRNRYGTVERVQVVDFLDPLADVFGRVHLVIGRAGSSTLAELAAAQLPALLIPLRGLAGDHQIRNARWFEQAGAATVVEPHEARSKILYVIRRLYRNPDTWAQMSQAAGRLAQTDAAANFWSWAQQLLELPPSSNMMEKSHDVHS